MIRSRQNKWTALTAALWLAVIAGCHSGDETQIPRSRTGSLPFPGMFSLYSAADPARLGPHRYERDSRLFDDEVERGTIYTTRAGFLDVAHLRMSIDYTRYCTEQMRLAIQMAKREWSVAGSNGSVFHLKLNYPPGWDALPPAQRKQMEEELALRSGQRLSYLILTWHELITWFGYRRMFFVNEARSSFTYDDVMSHLVGVRVADRVMREGRLPYDKAVTIALEDELLRLGALTAAGTAEAVRKVHGQWWADGEVIKRQVDVGLTTGVIHPWLVPGFPPQPSREKRADGVSEPFQVPSTRQLFGQEREFLSVSIEPRVEEADRARQYLPMRPAWFTVDQDLPILLEIVGQQMQKEFGAEALTISPMRTLPLTLQERRPE